MKQCIKYCLYHNLCSPIARQCNRSCRYFVRSCHPTSRMLYAVTNILLPATTSSPEVLRTCFHQYFCRYATCGPYASTNQQMCTPAHVHLQKQQMLCTGMRPYSLSNCLHPVHRRELLRVWAQKDYHLEGCKRRRLPLEIAGQQTS